MQLQLQLQQLQLCHLGDYAAVQSGTEYCKWNARRSQCCNVCHFCITRKLLYLARSTLQASRRQTVGIAANISLSPLVAYQLIQLFHSISSNNVNKNEKLPLGKFYVPCHLSALLHTLATVAPPLIFMFRANFHLFECNKSFAYRTVLVITLVCTVINAMFSISVGGDE